MIDTAYFNLPAIDRLRDRVSIPDATEHPAVAQLRLDADAALKAGPYSVTDAQRLALVPNPDPHDYRSFGPYWWPNPNTPDGLPYVVRDGISNPDALKGNHDDLQAMSQAVQKLALAYRLFGNDFYAAHAARLLRTWFLDPSTAMNPNMKYAQGIPGGPIGRCFGLIDTNTVPYLLDSIAFLSGSRHWTSVDQQGLRDWFKRLCDWFTTDPMALEEEIQPNNHGTSYRQQVARFAVFAGDIELAKKTVARVGERDIAHLNPDGSQPRELRRTRSYDYSTFNARMLLSQALLSRQLGVDLTSYSSPQGATLCKMVDWFEPYVGHFDRWPQQQILEFQPAALAWVLRLASLVFNDAKYEQWLSRLTEPGVLSNLFQLQFPAFNPT